MKIQGSVEIMVDEVDVEQATLRDKHHGRSEPIVMDAALYREEMQSFQRLCIKTGHKLEFERAQNMGKGNWLVCFIVTPIPVAKRPRKEVACE